MAVLACALATAPSAQEPGEAAAKAPTPPRVSEQRVGVLLDVLPSVQKAEALMQRAVDGFGRMPGLPPGFTERFKKAYDVDGLNRDIRRAFMKHMPATAAESAIAFFQSETGRQWTAVQRAVGTKSEQASRAESQKIMQAIMLGREVPPVRKTAAPEQGSTAALVNRVLDLTRIREQTALAMHTQIDALRKNPMMPKPMVEKIAKALSVERMMAMTMPLYVEQSDKKTLAAVIAWAETPEATSFHEALIEVMPEIIDLGQKAGQKAGRAATGGR